MKIHLHTICWNEEKLLPYFFRHYDPIVDRYFILDNYSSDNSFAILNQNQKVTAGKFLVEGDSFVDHILKLYNQCWKKSRGEADWIIVCNIDEHLYHPNLKNYLQKSLDENLSLIPSVGYQMLSDSFPKAAAPLYEVIRYGVKYRGLHKNIIFNPNKIEEINFNPGRHGCAPTGELVVPTKAEVKLLHYKYLGLEYLLSRYAEAKPRLGKLDLIKGYCSEYLWNNETIIANFAAVKKNLKEIVPAKTPVEA